MRNTRLFTIAAAALALAACNDDNGSSATAFDPLVTDLIQNQTTETGAPVEVNGQSFAFPASDTDFDDVLPPDTGAVVQ